MERPNTCYVNAGKKTPTGWGAIYLQDPHRKPSQVNNGGLGVGGVLGAGEAQDPVLSIARQYVTQMSPSPEDGKRAGVGMP